QILCGLRAAQDTRLHAPRFQARFERDTAGRIVVDDQHAEVFQVASDASRPRGKRNLVGLNQPEAARGVNYRSSRRIIFEPDTTPDEFDELRADRKAQAGAAVFAGAGAVPLLEGDEDAVSLSLRDADARVGDGQV